VLFAQDTSPPYNRTLLVCRRREVFLTPLGHLLDDRLERFAVLGQRILDAHRFFADDFPIDQLFLLPV